jgi:molybdate transport system ATP-binding protein
VLDASIEVRQGSFQLACDVQVADGEVVAIVGPNGAGKSTVLRALAGLVPIDRGRIVLDGDVLDDPVDGTFVEVAARSVAMVFQDDLLFPRLSALDNVAFGLRAGGHRRAAARAAAAEWLHRLDLRDHLGAKPSTLSGGQRQRVALARALATAPRLLLLDEPLSALDASTRVHVRAELRRHLSDLPGGRLLVTHDPIDALVLADRIVVLEGGRVVQQGSAAEIAARPASRYVADLLGLNLLAGTAEDRYGLRLDAGGSLVVADPLPAGQIAVVVRPQAVALHREQPTGSPRNTWPATIGELRPDGHRVRVTLTGPVPLIAEVTVEAVAELDLRPGATVWASVKAVDVMAYER